jgi:hypothetical protein
MLKSRRSAISNWIASYPRMELRGRSPFTPTGAEPFKIQAALTALVAFAASREQENTNLEEEAGRGMIQEGAYMTAALYRADSTDLNDTQLIKHLERMKASFGALGDVASEISRGLPEMQPHAEALAKQCTAYSTEAQNYNKALKRTTPHCPLSKLRDGNRPRKCPSFSSPATTRRPCFRFAQNGVNERYMILRTPVPRKPLAPAPAYRSANGAS